FLNKTFGEFECGVVPESYLQEWETKGRVFWTCGEGEKKGLLCGVLGDPLPGKEGGDFLNKTFGEFECGVVPESYLQEWETKGRVFWTCGEGEKKGLLCGVLGDPLPGKEGGDV
nr:hypothetical protein [Tanacetum cinerariifolium]